MRRRSSQIQGVFGALTVLALASCSSDRVNVSDSSAPVTTNQPSITSTTEIATTPPSEPSFNGTLSSPITGFSEPVDLAIRPSVVTNLGTTFIVERGGTIRPFYPDGTSADPVADLSGLIKPGGEQGLLGLTFSLDGNRAFVNYTDLAGDTTIDQFNVDPDGTFIMSSRQTLLILKQPFPNHNGGDLLLSPDGRALLVFTGDGGAGGDPLRAALDLESYLGKILMIDLATAPAQDPTTSAKVWAVGLRNPWRVSYDSVSGNLWIADVGQNLWEEINVLPYASTEGVSFGWSAVEATHPYNTDQEALNNTFTQVAPIHEYEHVDNNCSISGGAVYRGTQAASVGTWYIFSDYCSGNVQALCVTDELTSCGILSLGNVPQAVAVMPDANGELWVLSLSGEAVPITKKS
jgi:glucose/arabinose dehydrogenase